MPAYNQKRHGRPVMTQHPLGVAYDSIEFSLADGLTDYDVKSNESDAFDDLPSYTTVVIRTDQDISIKFNSTSGKTITVAKRNSPFMMDNLIEISNIYLTNASGNTASVKILGVDKGG